MDLNAKGGDRSAPMILAIVPVNFPFNHKSRVGRFALSVNLSFLFRLLASVPNRDLSVELWRLCVLRGNVVSALRGVIRHVNLGNNRFMHVIGRT